MCIYRIPVLSSLETFRVSIDLVDPRRSLGNAKEISHAAAILPARSGGNSHPDVDQQSHRGRHPTCDRRGSGQLHPELVNFDEKDVRVPLGLGARHMAAAGVSRDTDALAIVVSEETGQISLAIDGRIQRGQKVLLEGVGGGFTWGAVLLQF